MVNVCFVPLDINKKNWDLSKHLIFLNRYYEIQLSEVEKKRLNYSIIPDSLSSVNESEFIAFENKMIVFFQNKLNAYHNVNLDIVYWKKMFSGWMRPFIINCFEKIEFLNELNKLYSNYVFESCVDVEDDDAFLFAKLAEKVCSFSISYVVVNHDIKKVDKKNIGEYNNLNSNFFVIKFLQYMSEIKRFEIKNIVKYLKKLKSKILLRLNSNKARVLLIHSYFPQCSADYFINNSNYKIKCAENIFYTEKTIKDVSKDKDFRGLLKSELNQQLEMDSNNWERVTANMICDFLPTFFIEKYKQYLDFSKSYLRRNKHLKYIFTVCINYKSLFSFLCIYAQTLGIKIGTMAHGGNYGITQDYDYESYIADYFYGWGRWTEDVKDNSAVFIRCPTHRLSTLYNNRIKHNKYFLFAGGYIPFFCNDMVNSLKNYRITNFDVIQNRIIFFKSLTPLLISNFIVRNHPFDQGYHETRLMSDEIPDLTIDGFKQNFFSENIGGKDGRNETFSKRVLNCKMLIYDDIETPFTEALYLDKPFVLLLVPNRYSIRDEELPYFKMMQDIGLLFYDAKECAKLINSIYKNIDGWWFDKKRQEVVSIIKDRYVTHSDDVDKWWLENFKKIGSID